MSVILYLDTTANRLMIGVSRDGVMCARYVAQTDSHRYHSALLIPAIQQVLREAGVSVRDLTALAVNHGPGSFTGIRTGITTARTSSQFLGLPVHVFNTFELLANQSPEPVDIFLDALRGRVYHACLRFDETGPVYCSPAELKVLSPDEAPATASQVIVSPSLYAQWEPLMMKQGISLRAIPEDWDSPAAMLALVQRYGDRFARPWLEVKPFYLQEPSITLKRPQTPLH
ncbi:MAG TPA: tRNA (adenosine(37)-N6)-threonylcarbamoyltransferase complex dimerization subunit type 1 TsaB [Coleofasciculaceae cyanobacterium]|jgi:tRNA threonylcarbamoyladenosine biosynthesis protein TsaB